MFWDDDEVKIIKRHSKIIEEGSLSEIVSEIEKEGFNYGLLGRIVFCIAYLRGIKPEVEDFGNEFLLQIGDCSYDYYPMGEIEDLNKRIDYIKELLSDEFGTSCLGLPEGVKTWMLSNLKIHLINNSSSETGD